MVHRTPELLGVGRTVGVDPAVLRNLEAAVRRGFEAARMCDAPKAFASLAEARSWSAMIERRALERRDLASRLLATTLMDATQVDLERFWRRSCRVE